MPTKVKADRWFAFSEDKGNLNQSDHTTVTEPTGPERINSRGLAERREARQYYSRTIDTTYWKRGSFDDAIKFGRLQFTRATCWIYGTSQIDGTQFKFHIEDFVKLSLEDKIHGGIAKGKFTLGSHSTVAFLTPEF